VPFVLPDFAVVDAQWRWQIGYKNSTAVLQSVFTILAVFVETVYRTQAPRTSFSEAEFFQ